MVKVVFASNNVNKRKEIALALPLFVDLVSVKLESPDETGDDLISNAKIKAEFWAKSTRIPSLADDSGLSVDALLGAPGIHSARYANPDRSEMQDSANNRKLLKEMNEKENREAKYTCAMVLAIPGKNEITFYETVGETSGRIMYSPVEGSGFGYDPVFFSYDLQKPFSLASLEEKNRVSHRGRAVNKMSEIMLKLWG